VNIVANMWDWDVVASFDGGASWQVQWPDSKKSPQICGEGGGGQGLGSSPYQIMFHHSNWWSSADSGETFFEGTVPAPGYPLGAFDYIRTAGSRTQPSGVYFSLAANMKEVEDGAQINDEEEDEDEAHDDEKEKEDGGAVVWLMMSENFGMNFTYTKMPADVQASSLIVDPTR
jgi:hypothetical protein